MSQQKITDVDRMVLRRERSVGRARTIIAPAPERTAPAIRRTLALKRLFDLVAASTLLVVSAPVIGLAALAVKLTSCGPAFYSQHRVGRFGRVFTIYKLRSMRHRCEADTGPCWSTPGDPRVTAVGRVLRALHIDELPQLINVLRGQMSLIGPRPERPEIAARLAAGIPGYDDRCAVLPGISGHAQVHLPPDVTTADVRMKIGYDREYLRRLSVPFDVLTLLRTALKIVGLYRPKRIHPS